VGSKIFRQVFYSDETFRAQDKSALDEIFQFADISRPVVSHQERENIRCYAVDGFALNPVEARDEMFGQKRNVFLALAQRRQVDAYDVNALK